MATQMEMRYGTTHGSGEVFTDFVFEQIKNGAAQNKNPEAAKKLALAVAWANGCPNPQGNIDRNGAWQNAIEDARNSFLFGHMLAVVKKSGNQYLFNQLKNGQEQLLQKNTIETENVPELLKTKKIVTGFAQTDPYAVTSAFWRVYDELTKGKRDVKTHQRVFNSLSFALDAACREARNLKSLRQFAFNGFSHVQTRLAIKIKS